MQALGFIETRGLLVAVEGADAMLKAADVSLLEKTYVGGGLVSIAVTGDVAAVKAAVEAGAAAVKLINDSLLVSQHVIPRPHQEVDSLFVSNNHKEGKEEKEAETAEAKPIENTEVSDNVSVNNTVIETTAEENTTQEPIVSETATEAEETKDETEENDTASLSFNPEEIHKGIIDKIVQESGFEKALEVLNKLKVTKLRNLAREYKNLKIAGRKISKADKKILLNEFNEYYKKN